MNSNVIKIKKTNSIYGVLIFLVLLIVISGIAFAAYLKNIGYDFSTLNIKDAIDFVKKHDTLEESSTKEISFLKEGSIDCRIYKDYIIVLSSDGIKWYSKNSQLLQEKALTLTKPVLRISAKYMAVVDISGRDIFFYKDKTQLWTRKLDNPIINADISADGFCTVVTQSKEYKSVVHVIDINGAEKYKKLCADDIVLSAKAIHNGEDVLINKVDTDSVKAGTVFEFNNIYNEKPFAEIHIADNILPISLSFGENEVAVGQNIVIFMDKQGKEVWRKTVDSIFCVAPKSDKYIVLAGKFAGEDKPTIIVLNEKGEEVYKFDQPDNIVGMDVYGERLALRTQRSIYLYSIKGKQLGQYSHRNEIKDAYLVGNNEVVLISGATISKINIKGA